MADVAPVATVTVLGTEAAVWLLDNEMFNPPEGAAEPIVTVPVAVLPPRRLMGDTDRPVNTGAFTVKLALRKLLPTVPLIFATVWLPTGRVETLNVATVEPPGTDTIVGTVTEDWLLASETDSPPTGATDEIVTVPVELEPPVTDVGLNVRPANVGAVIEIGAETVEESRLAVILPLWDVLTAWVETVNVALTAPP